MRPVPMMQARKGSGMLAVEALERVFSHLSDRLEIALKLEEFVVAEHVGELFFSRLRLAAGGAVYLVQLRFLRGALCGGTFLVELSWIEVWV